MIKKIALLLAILFFSLSINLAYAAPGWHLKQRALVDDKLVETGRDNYQIYCCRDKYGNKSLIFICHGIVSNGKLAIQVDDYSYLDYIGITERTIMKRALKGDLKGFSFDAIYLYCCYVGFADKNEFSEKFGCPFFTLSLNKGKVGVKEIYRKDGSGRVTELELYDWY